VPQHPVTHFEVNARDAKAMQKFYGDLFGWGIDTNNPMDYGMIDTKAKGSGINGGIGASQDGRSWVTFYVQTPDPVQTLSKVERLGGRTVMPPMDMAGLTYALFADPEGNVIGLAKMIEQQPQSKNGERKAAARTATKKKTTARKKTSARKKTTARTSSTRRRTAKRR
jgi:predicted enzyme related to lactoylglutathione lyase